MRFAAAGNNTDIRERDLKTMTRADGRNEKQIRKPKITIGYTKYAEGSVLIEMGDTRVLCNASVEEGAPKHVPEGTGWVTAEYSMLPRATQTRRRRDVSGLKLAPRSAEIQRLIGRALRSVVDLEALGDYTITVDCDVLQADGGTRTASITGAFVALKLACRRMAEAGLIAKDPVKAYMAAISVGVVDGVCMVDLNYGEDSHADVDMNVVLSEDGSIIEIQGTGEERPFTRTEYNRMFTMAGTAIRQLIRLQKKALGE